MENYTALVDTFVAFCTESRSHTQKEPAFSKDDESYGPDERLNNLELRKQLKDLACDDLPMWLGVVMMEAGAKIGDDNMKNLHSIATAHCPPWSVLGIQERGGYAHGMYKTGQAQIVTAVNLYQPAAIPVGKKIKADVGKELIKSRCAPRAVGVTRKVEAW
ncbi:hypothetical protein N0V82_001420 [Gnomoniopsis sp. IMI 355080]|nr:hypothetical protein N0V82_001420 [Gnomoniopsis sp. IMI 355080]